MLVASSLLPEADAPIFARLVRDFQITLPYPLSFHSAGKDKLFRKIPPGAEMIRNRRFGYARSLRKRIP